MTGRTGQARRASQLHDVWLAIAPYQATCLHKPATEIITSLCLPEGCVEVGGNKRIKHSIAQKLQTLCAGTGTDRQETLGGRRERTEILL